MEGNSGYTKKEGQGSLFKNDKKTAANQPDFTGSVVIGGVEKRIAAWTRTARNGGTYLSISISDFQGGGGQGGYSGGGQQRSGYGQGSYQQGGYNGGYQQQGGYSQSFQQPSAPAPAPAPSIEDMPAEFGEDMPF